MKVIKKGRPQKGWSKKIKCSGTGNGGGGCGATLLVEKDDVYVVESHKYPDERETFYTFTCCECGVETDLPVDKVPNNINFQTKKEWSKKHIAATEVRRFIGGREVEAECGPGADCG